jgi:3-deoxy-D-arabino-heptulosonate 7-phosphate (DAHP) synthase
VQELIRVSKPQMVSATSNRNTVITFAGTDAVWRSWFARHRRPAPSKIAEQAMAVAERYAAPVRNSSAAVLQAAYSPYSFQGWAKQRNHGEIHDKFGMKIVTEAIDNDHWNWWRGTT